MNRRKTDEWCETCGGKGRVINYDAPIKNSPYLDERGHIKSLHGVHFLPNGKIELCECYPTHEDLFETKDCEDCEGRGYY